MRQPRKNSERERKFVAQKQEERRRGVEKLDKYFNPKAKIAHIIVDVQEAFSNSHYFRYNEEYRAIMAPRGSKIEKNLSRHHKENSYIESWGTKDTEEVSERIAEAVPAIRGTGIPTVFLYVKEGWRRGFHSSMGGPFKVREKWSDILISKPSDDGFKYSDLDETLQEMGIENLIFSGFCISKCAFMTIVSAMDRNYKAAFLEDCVGDDRRYDDGTSESMNILENRVGVLRTDFRTALKYLRVRNKKTANEYVSDRHNKMMSNLSQ